MIGEKITGSTMIIAEKAYRRLKAESASNRELRRTVKALQAELSELQARCDSQNERIVDYRVEREECIERVTAISRKITERTAHEHSGRYLEPQGGM